MRLNKNFYDIKEHWEEFGASKNWDAYITKRNTSETEHTNLMKTIDGVNGRHIIELGVGDGSFTKYMLYDGASVHGVDFAQSLLDRARVNLKACSRFSLSPIIRDFSIITDLSASIVLAVSMLEHLPEDMTERIFQDARRILGKGGKFIFRLPIREKHEAIKNKNIPALDTVYWTEKEIKDLAIKYKYEIIKIGFYSIFRKATEL